MTSPKRINHFIVEFNKIFLYFRILPFSCGEILVNIYRYVTQTALGMSSAKTEVLINIKVAHRIDYSSDSLLVTFCVFLSNFRKNTAKPRKSPVLLHFFCNSPGEFPGLVVFLAVFFSKI